MEVFIPHRATYERLLQQHGGGIDRYIYHVQEGQGLGNFFAGLLRHVKPLISSGIKSIAPDMLNIGSKIIDQSGKALISHIEKGQQKAQQAVKRKRDNLDVSV